MAVQDSLPCALVHVSQCRETAWIIELEKFFWMSIFFDRGIAVSLTLNSFSRSGFIFVSPVLGAASWAPFLLWAWHRAGVASSTHCSHIPNLSPCRERGWLAPQLLWCACQQLCTARRAAAAGLQGLYSTDNKVKLCRNSGKTD